MEIAALSQDQEVDGLGDSSVLGWIRRQQPLRLVVQAHSLWEDTQLALMGTRSALTKEDISQEDTLL